MVAIDRTQNRNFIVKSTLAPIIPGQAIALVAVIKFSKHMSRVRVHQHYRDHRFAGSIGTAQIQGCIVNGDIVVNGNLFHVDADEGMHVAFIGII